MVCSLGSGRMAAMARLLVAGSFSQTIAEEVGNHRLAAQYIQRELRGADEANLLDEEDMHVFDLKPMTDPLYLVRCNACKKPIKASQYAAHAELCKLVSSSEVIVPEIGCVTGHKKPPRKERKKSLTAYTGGDLERTEPAEADDVTASEFHLDKQIQLTSSFPMEAKRNSSSADEALIIDGSGVSPRNPNYPAGAMPPPTKRSKLIAAERLPMLNHLETASGIAKSFCLSTQEARSCREVPKGSSGTTEKTSICVSGYQTPGQAHDCCLLSKDVPAPLATKMFYSQRNQRLRSALAYLYCEASSLKRSDDLVTPNSLQGNAMLVQISSPKNISHEEIDVQREKTVRHKLSSVQKPDQITADSSDVYLGELGGHTPLMNVSNHAPLNNSLRPQMMPTGITRSNYLSKPFAFAGNSDGRNELSLPFHWGHFGLPHMCQI
ncbi:uncharacterized protein LOC127800296 isoform X2 [Diospyros lotus]|uniref:uncharacterized protein LOC127800296 isoform X2 n=1 Tax=Diospyros lotus TaxID=55363 RepID=UPI0022519AC6|nr:uncharacterized protein LOC127800296 isoform X2 [Diospyros lotus]